MSKYKVLRWGILGAGEIAEVFVEALSILDDHKVVAVASRDINKAKKFINKAQLKDAEAVGSYEDMGAMDNVDIVYVATIHPQHLHCVSLMLNSGKHVLCEKPIAMNADETKSMVDLAREKSLFLMEGMWNRFHPVNQRAHSWIKEGKIGTIKHFEAFHGFFGEEDKDNRLMNRELGGGSLLDVGVYCLSMAQFFIGKMPLKTVGLASLDPDTGVDRGFSAIADYGDDLIAALGGSMVQKLTNSVRIIGTEGLIVVPNFVHPQKVELYDLIEDENASPVLIDTYEASDLKNGFEFEAIAVKEALDNGLLECEVMPLDDSIAVSTQMTQLIDDWGIEYHCI